jgi:hypothetical protein
MKIFVNQEMTSHTYVHIINLSSDHWTNRVLMMSKKAGLYNFLTVSFKIR